MPAQLSLESGGMRGDKAGPSGRPPEETELWKSVFRGLFFFLHEADFGKQSMKKIFP